MIDHRASAKLSSVRGEDQLVVREYLTEESARVLVVIDRSPSMGLFPRGLPWLSKPAALVESVRVILSSAAAAQGLAGMLDASTPRYWAAPDGRTAADQLIERASLPSFDSPAGALEEALQAMLQIERGLDGGTFVFVVSDFIESPDTPAWDAMRARKWDVVPVVMQDPVWERSFPDVAGMLLALTDPASATAHNVWLTEADASERRVANEQRAAALGERFEALGFDTVQVCSAEPADVLGAFSDWATGRRDGARTVR